MNEKELTLKRTDGRSTGSLVIPGIWVGEIMDENFFFSDLTYFLIVVSEFHVTIFFLNLMIINEVIESGCCLFEGLILSDDLPVFKLIVNDFKHEKH